MTGDDARFDAGQSDESIRWRVRLSDREPRKTVAVFAVAILAFLVGALVFRNVVLGCVGFAIILGSTAEFWLGTSFSVDDKKATVRTGFSTSVMEWKDVKRVARDSGGIRLSPLTRAGMLDAFRGVYLRYGRDNKESIERAVVAFGKLSDNTLGDRVDGAGD